MRFGTAMFVTALLFGTQAASGSIVLQGGAGGGNVIDGIGGSAQFTATYSVANRRVSGGGSTSGGFGGVFASIALTGPTPDETYSFNGSASALAGFPLGYRVSIYLDFTVVEPMTFHWQPNQFARGSSFSGANDADGILDVGETYRLSIDLDFSRGDPNQTDFTLTLQTIPAPSSVTCLFAVAVASRRRRDTPIA
jgi:hypothetical protein